MTWETTTQRLNREQPVPGEDCIHEEMDYTDRSRITNKDTVQTWLTGSPVLNGTEWCWSCGQWERKEKTG